MKICLVGGWGSAIWVELELPTDEDGGSEFQGFWEEAVENYCCWLVGSIRALCADTTEWSEKFREHDGLKFECFFFL